MSQTFGEAYADVVDYGAVGDGRNDDTAAIQAAIDTLRHVVFPLGTYLFSTSVDASSNTIPLTFANDEQRCEFLAGAILKPANGDAYVLITGQRQRITGLRIEADDDVVAHSPLLDIYGAFDLWLQELRVTSRSIGVSATGVSAAVRVMCLTKCNFVGGRICGGAAQGTVGLWLASSYDYYLASDPNPNPGCWGSYVDDADYTAEEKRALAQASSGAYEVGAVGLRIESFGWAVRVGCITDDPSFVNCAFVDNVDGALVLKDDAEVVAASGAADAVATATTAVGFNLIGCHFSGANPTQYVRIDAGCSWQGGVVIGCTFDGGWGGGLLGGGVATSPGVRQRAPGAADKAGGSSVGASLVASSQRSPAGAFQGSVGSRRGFSVEEHPLRTLAGAALPAKGMVEGATSTLQATSLAVPGWCIFAVYGYVSGVVVSGCRSGVYGFRSLVWNIWDDADVSRTCDMFNCWAQATVAGGPKEGRLVRMTADESGGVTLTAESVRFDTESMGFFGTTPSARQEYHGVGPGDRWLGSTNAERVVSQLLTDLAALGLVKKRTF